MLGRLRARLAGSWADAGGQPIRAGGGLLALGDSGSTHAVGRGQERIDTPLLLVAAALMLLGVVMVYSATISLADSPRYKVRPTHFLVRHLFAIGVAIVAAVAAFSVPMARWQRLAPLAFVVAFVLLVVVLIPGVGTGALGARRWISLAMLNLQPSELMKVACVLYAASFTVRKQDYMHSLKRGFLPIGLVMLVVGGLLQLQPDLGAFIVIVAIAMGILFGVTYGEMRRRDEFEHSKNYYEVADVERARQMYQTVLSKKGIQANSPASVLEQLGSAPAGQNVTADPNAFSAGDTLSAIQTSVAPVLPDNNNQNPPLPAPFSAAPAALSPSTAYLNKFSQVGLLPRMATVATIRSCCFLASGSVSIRCRIAAASSFVQSRYGCAMSFFGRALCTVVATSQLELPAGRYDVWAVADDGVRIFVDGRKLIDLWSSGTSSQLVDVQLGEGRHTFRVEYFQRTGTARLQIGLRPFSAHGAQRTP